MGGAKDSLKPRPEKQTHARSSGKPFHDRCRSVPPNATQRAASGAYIEPVQIDHLVVAVPGLARAASEWAARGFASVEGGVHPQWGTANRLIVLDTAYVELVGVLDSGVAAESRFGSWVAAGAARRESLIGVVMRDREFEEVCRRRNLKPIPGQRRRPDGGLVRWQLAGLESMVDAGLPAFIDWAEIDPRLEDGVGKIESLDLGGGAATHEWLGGAVDAVHVVDGHAGPRQAVVRRGEAVAVVTAVR